MYSEYTKPYTECKRDVFTDVQTKCHAPRKITPLNSAQKHRVGVGNSSAAHATAFAAHKNGSPTPLLALAARCWQHKC
jgi:hypothetical protein